MCIFDISKELIVTLKYYLRKKHKRSRSHVEIMFAF